MPTKPKTVEATFCFVDVAGFTALTEAHGDHAAADLIQRFGALVNDALGGLGQLVDAVGDAVLVMAPRPADAIEFVSRLFTRVATEPDFPALRAGLHHGTVVERDGRFFGSALNVAARVTAQAHGDQVLGTTLVADAARASHVEVARLGGFALRNLREPVDLFALNVACRDAADVIDPVCRMRVQPARAAGRLRHDDVDYWFCSLDCASSFAASPEAYVRGHQAE